MKYPSRCCGAFLVLLFAVPLTWRPVWAGDDESRQVIPYDGILEFDGVPVNGDYQLRFSLYEEASAEPDGWAWQETIAVEIVSGRFSALLGAGQDLTDELLLSRQLYLSIAIENPENPGAEDFFVFANRHRIVPTPFSYVATAAPDFWVSQSLTVQGETTLRGPVTVDNDLIATGTSTLADLSVTGSATVNELDVTGSTTLGDLGVTETATIEALAVGPDGSTLTVDADGVAVGEDGLTAPTANIGQLTVSNATIAGGTVTGTLNVGNFHNDSFGTAHEAIGSGSVALAPVASSFCALTRVEIDNPGSGSGCDINSVDGYWRLIVDEDGFGANAYCEAKCITF